MIRSKRFASAAALVMVLVVLAHIPVQAQDNQEICNKALLKCGVDAAIAGLLSGGTPMLLLIMGCLIGYDFCLKYYVPLK